MHNQHARFWENFAKNIYGKEAFAPNEENLGLSLDQQSLFNTTVNYCEDIQDKQWGVRLFVDDNDLLDGSGLGSISAARKYFPTLADESFEGYHRRMLTLCDEYCLIINDPERIDYNVYQWCRDFLHPLFTHRGMNNIGIYNALFIGNYKKTNFGVHFDAESVFHIPLIGKKSMRFWSAEYIQANPELSGVTEYSEHVDASVGLTCEPGSFVYWPKKAWHIAESEQGLCVSMALSLQEYSDITPYIINNLLLPQLKNGREIHDQFELAGRFDDSLQVTGIPFNAEELAKTAVTIPDVVDNTFARLQSLTSSDQAKTLWLTLLSSFGFTNPPALDNTLTFSATADYQIDNRYPVLNHLLSDNTRLIAANGHLYRLLNSSATLAMINTIASSTELSASQLLAASEHLETSTQQAFLDFLCASRAMHSVE